MPDGVDTREGHRQHLRPHRLALTVKREHQCEVMAECERLDVWIAVVTQHVAPAIEDDPHAPNRTRGIKQGQLVPARCLDVLLKLRCD